VGVEQHRPAQHGEHPAEPDRTEEPDAAELEALRELLSR